eukprot:g33571.t2
MQNMARLLNRGGNAQAEVDKEQIAVQLRQLAQNVGQINMEAMPQVHLGEVAFPQVPVPHLSNEAQALMLTAANFPAVQPNLSNEAQSFVVTAANFPQVPSMAEVAAPMAATAQFHGQRGHGWRRVRRAAASNAASTAPRSGLPHAARGPSAARRQATGAFVPHQRVHEHGQGEDHAAGRSLRTVRPPVLRKDPVTGQPTAQPQLPDQATGDLGVTAVGTAVSTTYLGDQVGLRFSL